jgi:hypothetical protein
MRALQFWKAVTMDRSDFLDRVLATLTPSGFSAELKVRRFAHRVNASAPGSGLMVQIQTEPEYAAFVDRAQVREVLELQMPVAAVEDVLQGKIWAAQEPMRRPSKHLKDLSDIARIIETYPELMERVPPDVLAQIPEVRT